MVEAMKMQNVLRAEQKGVVKKVNCKAGDTLRVDAVMIEFDFHADEKEAAASQRSDKHNARSERCNTANCDVKVR